jgi:hypothetical protein
MAPATTSTASTIRNASTLIISVRAELRVDRAVPLDDVG